MNENENKAKRLMEKYGYDLGSYEAFDSGIAPLNDFVSDYYEGEDDEDIECEYDKYYEIVEDELHDVFPNAEIEDGYMSDLNVTVDIPYMDMVAAGIDVEIDEDGIRIDYKNEDYLKLQIDEINNNAWEKYCGNS